MESADTDLAHYQQNKGSENGKEGTNPEAIKIKLDKAQDLISQFQELLVAKYVMFRVTAFV